MLLSEVIEDATVELARAGVVSAGADGKLLVCFVLGIDKSDLELQVVQGRKFPLEKLEFFKQVLARRVKREPLQHITGIAYFRHLELEVGPGVFIPRPETEQLVDVAINQLRDFSNPVVVDLCSGSGAISIAIQTEVVDSKVYSVELSREAFSYLSRNVKKYGLDPKLFRNEDLATAFSELKQRVDLVVSNPPYIPDSAVPIDLEVSLHDPKIALYGGQDGLDVIRVISERAKYLLRPKGRLLIEHADTQASAITELLLSSGWKEVVSLQDLAGKDRMILASKP